MILLTSTISWCEEKYIIVSCIAEFWNTITGLCLCISAILQYKIYNDRRLLNMQITLFIVGVGTMLFHGTLLYIFQLLDEIPMLILCVEYIKFIDNRCGHRFEYIKMYYPVPIIVASYYISHSLQIFLFQGTFAFYTVIVIYKCVLLQIKYKNKYLNNEYKKVVLLFVSSLCIWTIENNYCGSYNYIQLHAIWHIITSIAFFYLNGIFYKYLQNHF